MTLKRYVLYTDGHVTDNTLPTIPLTLINTATPIATSDDIFELADCTWKCLIIGGTHLAPFDIAYRNHVTRLYAPVGDDYICVWRRS